MSLLLFAQDPPPAPNFMQGPLFFPLMIVLMVVFWIMIVLPASRRQRKEQEQMLAKLGRGSKILTSGGIVGVIVSARDGEDEIVIKSEDTRLRIKRNVVIQVIGTDDAETNKS